MGRNRKGRTGTGTRTGTGRIYPQSHNNTSNLS